MLELLWQTSRESLIPAFISARCCSEPLRNHDGDNGGVGNVCSNEDDGDIDIGDIGGNYGGGGDIGIG